MKLLILIYFIIGALFTVISWLVITKKRSNQDFPGSILIYFGICPFIWPIMFFYFVNNFIYKVVKKYCKGF